MDENLFDRLVNEIGLLVWMLPLIAASAVAFAGAPVIACIIAVIGVASFAAYRRVFRSIRQARRNRN